MNGFQLVSVFIYIRQYKAKVFFYLSLQGAIFRAELKTIGRISGTAESPDGKPLFACSEFARSTVTREGLNVPRGAAAPRLVKDIETITVYTKTSDSVITALQRTASYPPKPRGQATGDQLLEDAIDVRCYTVTYKLRSTGTPA
jgi:hypothetical protein